MKIWAVLFIIILMILAGLAGAFYFSFISPSFQEKPELEKPEIIITRNPSMDSISDEGINYIANEIGAYMLHRDMLSGEDPVLEFLITDSGETFTTTVIESIPETARGNASSPDLRIKGKKEIIEGLIASDDVKSKLVEQVSQGNIEIEITADETTLAMKGYKVIYDLLNKGSNEITGQVIARLNPSGIVNLIKLFVLTCMFLILELFFMHENIT